MATVPFQTVRGLCYALENAIEKRNAQMIKHLLKSNRHLQINSSDAYKLMYRVYENVNFDRDRQFFVCEMFQAFTDGGVDVNSCNTEGHTVLHIAMKYRMKKVFDCLISCGSNIQMRDKFDNSLIHFYILLDYKRLTFVRYSIDAQHKELLESQSIDFIKWAVLKGLDVDSKNIDGDTALHLAARFGLFHTFSILLDSTNNVTIVNNHGLTALQCFTTYLSAGWAWKGLSYSRCGPSYEKEAYYVCTIIEKFWRKGYSFDVVDDTGFTPLHYILNQVQSNKEAALLNIVKSVVKQFTKNINSRDENGNTVLNIIMMYLEDYEDRSTFDQSKKRSYEDIVYTLLSNGAKAHLVNINDVSPILIAARQCKLRYVKAFIRSGADLQSRYKEGENLLHCLIKKYGELKNRNSKPFEETFNLLLRGGCDVNAKDDNGKTPLHEAILLQDYSLVKELFKYGADIDDNIDFVKSTHKDLMKSHVSKLPIHEMLKQLLILHPSRFNRNETFHDHCLIEIERLKKHKITKSISLYDLLNMNRNSLCNYVNNEKWQNFVDTAKYEKEYPIYHIIISSIYYMAMARRKMLEPAKQAWYVLTGLNLPDTCLRQILNNSSNATLRVMAEVIVDCGSLWNN